MRLSGWLLSVAFSVAVGGADVPIDVRAAGPGAKCLIDAAAVARSGDAQVRRPVIEGQAVLPLSLDRAWRISVESERCWSDVREWTWDHGDRVVLNVFPGGEVSGTFVSNSRPQERLRATLFLPDETTTDCSLAFPKWSCHVPADVPFDLRLELPGVAAVHFWSVAVRPQEVRELEPQRLLAGASVSGWIHDPDGKPLSDARVVLTPFEPDAPDEVKRVALRRTAKTNRRGFFQFALLPADDYQIVSHVEGFSPAIVPLVTVREGERLEWPRAISHLPLASLELTVQPPTDPAGKPWVIELVEHTRVPAQESKQPLKRAASSAGQWSATGLRADLYRLNVRNASDSVMERAWVDLSAGGEVTFNVQVSRFRVEGVLRVGDEPLQAEIRFATRAGKMVRVITGEDGRFETAFPESGVWKPTVYYTIDGVRAEVNAPVVEIPEVAEGPAQVDIELPAGRIRGKVILPDGTAVKAAVHIRSSDGILIAQQVTSASGAFTFIGLRKDGYALEAEGERGATPQPLSVRAQEKWTDELRVVLEPYRQLTAQILTPSGAAASGTVVDLSLDGGHSWTRQAVRTDGIFRYSVPAGVDAVQLIALTYAYPSAFVRVLMNDSPVTIRLQRTGGLLRIKGRTPFVMRDQAMAPFNMFFFPEPFGRFDGAIHLEPGPYTICPRPQRDSSCRDVVITPHGDTTIEFERARGATEAP